MTMSSFQTCRSSGDRQTVGELSLRGFRRAACWYCQIGARLEVHAGICLKRVSFNSMCVLELLVIVIARRVVCVLGL